MGISIDGARHHYINAVTAGTAEKKEISKSGKGGQFDEILITSNSREVEEKKMTEELSKKVLSEVSASVSEEKISDLKQRVAYGTYQVDVDKLVERILLQRGDQDDE